MFVTKQARMFAAFAVIAAQSSLSCVALRAQSGFPAEVLSTHPIAFYRIDATSGKSLVGATTYKTVGSVEIADSGAPVPSANGHYVKLDGKTAYITTTQMGGVGAAASIMAWVNLDELPSKAGHFFYVAGESENGNDLDVQFETDNVLKFYTAAGGHLSYTPSPDSLIGQWHQIVVTLDTTTGARAIYWDGKSVATDKGGGQAGKKSVFTIGATPVFSGRFFYGAIDDVALWNRALKATEVGSIYSSAGLTAYTTAGGASSAATSASSGDGRYGSIRLRSRRLRSSRLGSSSHFRTFREQSHGPDRR